ncbi:MAG: ATP-binding cassette domain-containing protein [Rhabdochlamydiaceae bacterium]|nr:ATP-binding cassette domain-containing protein [Rhabdochlamydiaceae bacterium]
MFQCDHLSLSFHGEPLLVDVSFHLQKGERCALVGRNGSGKTTLFRLIEGSESADKGTISSPKGYRIGVLKQHLNFTKPTVLEEAAQVIPEEEQHRAEALLTGLGFDESQMDESPQQLSGGYQLRLELAKVLLKEPDCLLLDEPTNYLDILAIRFLTRFLKRWRGEMILISHDREFLDQVCTHTMGIHRQKVVKLRGSTSEFYSYIMQQEELQEKTRLKVEETRAHLQSYVDRFGAKASKAAQASARKKMIERLPQVEAMRAIASLGFKFHAAPFAGRKMLEANHLSFSYENPLISDLSLQIEKGERIAILGKNGCGKSTVLRLLAKELSPKEGSVEMRDNVICGYFGQTNIDRLNQAHTIEEEIALANPQLNFTQIRNLCGIMMFGGDRAKKKISMLSGGEKSRVLLGKILARPCNLLLLDEPTHHLDLESVEALVDAIEGFEGACVIVTHSELILNRLEFDKLIICHAGGRQEVFWGNYADFLEKIGWEEETEKKAAVSKPPKAKNPPMRPFSVKKLEDKIRGCEEAIQLKEASLHQMGQILLESIEKGKHSQEMYREVAEEQKACDLLYEQLEQLLIEKENIEKDLN